MPKKNPLKVPKLRHGWAINPKTRITPSKKSRGREAIERNKKSWVDELFD